MKLFLHILVGTVGAVVAVAVAVGVVYGLYSAVKSLSDPFDVYVVGVAMVAFMGAVIGVVIYFTNRPTTHIGGDQ